MVLVTGDAYVDHPSFGVAIVGRFLEWLGCRVGIVARPDESSPQSLQALGRPRLFWGVTAGNLDSQLARLTVMRKRRRDDPYAPDGSGEGRPANASIAYTSRVRQAFKGVPVVLGGVEASLRRFAYYDYWTDRVKRSILLDAKADVLAFGMAETAVAGLVGAWASGRAPNGIAGTAVVQRDLDSVTDPAILPSFEEVSEPSEAGKRAFAEMTRLIHLHTDPFRDSPLAQRHGDRWVVAQPPPLPLNEAEMDLLYELPFTNRPHPSYGARRIPAYEMIRDSVTLHRGCFGACRFCAIAVHQGTSISSRSREGVLRGVRRLAGQTGFRGTVSDLGGPSANMWSALCKAGHERCKRGGRCLWPDICPALDHGQDRLVALLRDVRRVEGVKHAFVSSGIRFDLALCEGGEAYLDELAAHHVSGRLKIAPEHIAPGVLKAMGKPPPERYREFLARFGQASARAGKERQAVVEYFISGHPGCTLQDMIELAIYLRRARVEPEQVQDFYPAPLTLAAAMYYTGLDPLTGESVYVARSDAEKALQRAVLLCHKPEFYRKAREALRLAGRGELIGTGRGCLVPPGP